MHLERAHTTTHTQDGRGRAGYKLSVERPLYVDHVSACCPACDVCVVLADLVMTVLTSGPRFLSSTDRFISRNRLRSLPKYID